MRTAALVLTALAFVLPSTAVAQTGPAAGACVALAKLEWPDVRITEAVTVAPTERRTRAHCRVTGVIGREITFEVLLPDQWNERFVMGGGGGFVGSVQNQAIRYFNDGYASAGTDTGHRAEGTRAQWALGDFERQVNYGHLAVHRTAVVSKALVRAYYGRPARYHYFFGCSNGGRQALMEAQRYPDDFDGIVSGAPALNFTNIVASFMKNMQRLYPNASALTPLLPAETLALLGTKVLEACDAHDRVKDGVIDDPRSCTFSPSSLPACPNDVAAAACVTKAQRAAIEQIYAPAMVNGDAIYAGQPLGGEADESGWRNWIVGPMSGPGGAAGAPPSLQWAFVTEFYKYFVFGDPNFDYTRYDLSTWARDTKTAASILNADNPDLDAFFARRGKLLIWHGWSDAALNAVETIRYHDRVLARNAQAGESMRLFMMPGVQHCAGGSGPDTVDWLAAISAWVERGEAPARIVATKLVNGAAARTRPLCPYPQRAAYSGAGNVDEATPFECRTP